MARGPATFGTILSAAVEITNAVLFVVCRACSGCWDWLEPVPTGHRGACVESGRTKKGPECNVVLEGGSGMQRPNTWTKLLKTRPARPRVLWRCTRAVQLCVFTLARDGRRCDATKAVPTGTCGAFGQGQARRGHPRCRRQRRCRGRRQGRRSARRPCSARYPGVRAVWRGRARQ